MTRTPQEIFQHHGSALIAGDIDEIVADYTDDAVILRLAAEVGLDGPALLRLARSDAAEEKNPG